MDQQVPPRSGTKWNQPCPEALGTVGQMGRRPDDRQMEWNLPEVRDDLGERRHHQTSLQYYKFGDRFDGRITSTNIVDPIVKTATRLI